MPRLGVPDGTGEARLRGLGTGRSTFMRGAVNGNFASAISLSILIGIVVGTILMSFYCNLTQLLIPRKSRRLRYSGELRGAVARWAEVLLVPGPAQATTRRPSASQAKVIAAAYARPGIVTCHVSCQASRMPSQ